MGEYRFLAEETEQVALPAQQRRAATYPVREPAYTAKDWSLPAFQFQGTNSCTQVCGSSACGQRAHAPCGLRLLTRPETVFAGIRRVRQMRWVGVTAKAHTERFACALAR